MTCTVPMDLDGAPRGACGAGCLQNTLFVSKNRGKVGGITTDELTQGGILGSSDNPRPRRGRSGDVVAASWVHPPETKWAEPRTVLRT